MQPKFADQAVSEVIRRIGFGCCSIRPGLPVPFQHSIFALTLTSVQNEVSNPVRLGTRGSLLAQTQSNLVAAELRRLRPDVSIELKIIKTTGDRITDRPLHDVGGKGLFTKELEVALLDGEIDFAVHSYKDVPVTMPLVDVTGLVIAAVPTREDARDVLVAGANVKSLADLPPGAKVGTGSLRRQCQLLAVRPDLQIVPLRGNIDTRLRKQREGEMDAVVLAAAGLIRAGFFDSAIMLPLPIEMLVPSAAQGALALQCRADDIATRQLLRLMNDPTTQTCVDLEREVIQLLNADCHSPIGVHAILISGNRARVEIAIGLPDGKVHRQTVSAHIDLISVELKRVLSIGNDGAI
jgi:hydroxymethylbilane synthase